jgi:hypothetical protein
MAEQLHPYHGHHSPQQPFIVAFPLDPRALTYQRDLHAKHVAHLCQCTKPLAWEARTSDIA